MIFLSHRPAIVLVNSAAKMLDFH